MARGHRLRRRRPRWANPTEPDRRNEVDRGPQGPITRPGVRRRRVMRAACQTAKCKSAKPTPVMSVEGRVAVLEGRLVSMDERLNSHLFKTAAALEYDGAVAQDLVERLSCVFAHIDALEAAVVAQPREDVYSVEFGASNGIVVFAEPENFLRLRGRISERRGVGDGSLHNGAAFDADDVHGAGRREDW